MHRPLLCSLALLVATGCSGGGGDATDAAPLSDGPPSPSCLEAEQHSDLDWLETNVFGRSCSNFSECHQGTRPAGDLDLRAGNAYGNLVNQPSHYFTDWMRVKPYSLEESYLMVRLRCYQEGAPLNSVSCEPGPLDGGVLMPPNSRPMCQQKIDAIKRWIMSGAPETGNGSDAAPPIVDAGIPDV